MPIERARYIPVTRLLLAIHKGACGVREGRGAIIDAVTAIYRIVAGTAEYAVITPFSVQGVITHDAENGIVAITTMDYVVSAHS